MTNPKSKIQNPKSNRFLFFIGVFFTIVGFIALTLFIMRDVFGMAVPIRGNLIPLSLVTVMGAGLIIASQRKTDKP